MVEYDVDTVCTNCSSNDLTVDEFADFCGDYYAHCTDCLFSFIIDAYNPNDYDQN